MAKKVTLTKRWEKWAEGSEGVAADPFWAYTAVVTMALSFASLICHFMFFMPGWFTGGALITMCVSAGITEAIFLYRRQFWWAWYWGLCVIIGVIVFEALSYFVGKPL
jgi:hypothetical protein